MQIAKKAIPALLLLVLFMTLLPWTAVTFARDWAVTGLWFFAFFLVYPLLSVALGILAGTELGKLWWIPLLTAAAFPFLFGVAVGAVVWDLFVYSAIYLALGVFSALATHCLKQFASTRKNRARAKTDCKTDDGKTK